MSEALEATMVPAVAVEASRQPNVLTQRLLAVGMAVSLGATACSGESDPKSADKPRVPENSGQVAENCDDLVFANSAANPVSYNSGSFLPKTGGEVDSPNKTQRYVKRLFSNRGPLAGKGDQASLNAVMSAVVDPAHDGVATNPNFNYIGTFANNRARYQAEGGIKAAREDCETSYETLSQVAEYDAHWTDKGEQVTQIRAVRDVDNSDKSERNNIIGIELKPVTTNSALHGVKLSLNETVKGLDGFNEVLIADNKGQWSGGMFVKGVTVGQGGKVTFEQDTPASADPDKKDQKAKSGGAKATNKGDDGATTGGGGGKGGDQGSGGKPGGGGPGCEGNGPGCPGEGPGPGGPGGPGEEEPKEPTPTTTRPTPTTTRPPTPTTTRPTPTTTRPPTPTTTRPPVTTTTTQPKGEDPGCKPTNPFC